MHEHEYTTPYITVECEVKLSIKEINFIELL
jgi:hypothetical protein